MSRTYAHIPYNVLILKAGEEDHDHRYGVCDIEDNASVHSMRSWRRHAHYRKCKKLRRYLVRCQHIVTNYEDTIFSMGGEHIHMTPHQVLSVYDYTEGRYIQAHWDLPAVKNTCSYNWAKAETGYSYYMSFLLRPYDVEAMHHTHEHFTEHTYVWLVKDDTIPCSCDERRTTHCTYDLPWSVQRARWGRGCSCCNDRGDLMEERYGNRNQTRMDLDVVRRAYNAGEDIEDLY